MSTPRPTAQDKFAAMFEKMIDDFCDTHSSDEVEAMFAKCDELFGGIEKRHRSPEGVAAPLEPLTARQFWHEWRDSKDGEETFVKFWPDEISDIAANFAEAYAAAVSKNLTDKYVEMEAKWMRKLLTVSNEIGEARDRISDLLNHDGGPGSIDYDAAKVFRARAKLLEFREITALRETK